MIITVYLDGRLVLSRATTKKETKMLKGLVEGSGPPTTGKKKAPQADQPLDAEGHKVVVT